ncbi:unnamed protein product [Enterobius vermicularis]|uniref:G_PROTEIN_RECEP_F1_2 domain-containing protein n=1 Tax=Enterobius vermicularis TaxID=51028 RepID=A0A0N4UT90_ENTVE|nr:unnamed protein product [Enterobius vermicularis]
MIKDRLYLLARISLMNPVIYCKFNRDFYVPFREMLCCRFCTLKEETNDSKRRNFADFFSLISPKQKL